MILVHCHEMMKIFIVHWTMNICTNHATQRRFIIEVAWSKWKQNKTKRKKIVHAQKKNATDALDWVPLNSLSKFLWCINKKLKACRRFNNNP